MSNEISIKGYFSRDVVKNKLNELLGKNAQTFATSVMQVVNSNAMLSNADPATVFNAAVVAATMKLPINNNLGYAYIVPYNVSKKVNGQWVKNVEAQFQMGYKGFVQLAQRTGQFKTISYSVVRSGQIKSCDPLCGYEFDWSIDGGEVVGYVAYFKLLNGFEAYNYMSAEQVEAHALKYSQSYQNDKKDNKTSSNWSKNFEAMALKTVIKLLLSKFAPLSIEMQTAIEADQAVIKDIDQQDFNYIDNISEDAQTTEPADYPDDLFAKNIETWKTYIQNRKKSADEIIKMVETRGKLTDKQRAQILEVQPTVIDAEPVNEPQDAPQEPVQYDDDNPFN